LEDRARKGPIQPGVKEKKKNKATSNKRQAASFKQQALDKIAL